MFVIVEGFDNCGKTTLVNQLSSDLKLLVINNRQRPRSVAESRAYMDLSLPLTKQFNVIFDRWQTISEPIYGPICRNHHLFARSQIEFQFEVMAPLRPLVIFCRPPDEIALRFGPIEQMSGVIDHATELLQAYDRSMENINRWFPVVPYDWTANTYSHLLDRVRAHYQGRK